jgi:FkbM family methyltransferase
MNLELVRKTARSVFGYRSPAYRLGARVLTQYQILRREGWSTMRQLNRIMGTSPGSQITLNLRSLRHPIVVRVGTDDVPTVVNNAIREEYGQFTHNFAPNVIVDAGAYIGDTAAYFLSRFPTSRVIALEPNEDSFPLASKNLLPYGDRVSLLKAALWTEVTTVRFGGVQTEAAIGSRGLEARTETIASLITKFDLNFIDLLKLDIEGAESQVVPAGVGNWLDKVGVICLETHGSEIEELLIPLLTGAAFSCTHFRNLWYCTRRR